MGMKIGVLTGGGDAPGLNAVIYGLVRSCKGLIPGCELVGYKFGYKGLYHNDFIPLNEITTSGILHQGGSILCNSNKDNLFDYIVGKDEDGKYIKRDVSSVAVDNMNHDHVDVLVVLGGDGTLTSARDFARKGVKVVGVPKTIDNDLASTDVTFGFSTAVDIIVENLGRLHTTAASHHRVLICEVMGRNSGWLALHGGVAGSADVILLPEFPFKLETIVAKLEQRIAADKPFAIIVVGEGAYEQGGSVVVSQIVADSPDPIRQGGVGKYLADKLGAMLAAKGLDNEVRSCALGHIQRGGDTSPADRLLSLRYAHGAAQLIANGKFGRMVTLKDGVIDSVSLEDVIQEDESKRQRKVEKDDELIAVAKGLGISFGTAL